MDDVKARARKILLSSRLELGNCGICKDSIFALILIREANLFPNISIKDIGKTVSPRSGDTFAAFHDAKRLCRIWMETVLERKPSLEVPICKYVTRAVIKEKAEEFNEIDV